MSKYHVQYYREYHDARRIHAWLLRAEGLIYRKIGDRLGVSHFRATQMVKGYGYKRNEYMRKRKTKFILDKRRIL